MYTAAELAERSGVDTAYIERLVELGILHADGEGSASFRPTDPRRVRMVRALDEGGVPLEGLGEAFRLGAPRSTSSSRRATSASAPAPRRTSNSSRPGQVSPSTSRCPCAKRQGRHGRSRAIGSARASSRSWP